MTGCNRAMSADENITRIPITSNIDQCCKGVAIPHMSLSARSNTVLFPALNAGRITENGSQSARKYCRRNLQLDIDRRQRLEIKKERKARERFGEFGAQRYSTMQDYVTAVMTEHDPDEMEWLRKEHIEDKIKEKQEERIEAERAAKDQERTILPVLPGKPYWVDIVVKKDAKHIPAIDNAAIVLNSPRNMTREQIEKQAREWRPAYAVKSDFKSLEWFSGSGVYFNTDKKMFDWADFRANKPTSAISPQNEYALLLKNHGQRYGHQHLHDANKEYHQILQHKYIQCKHALLHQRLQALDEEQRILGRRESSSTNNATTNNSGSSNENDRPASTSSSSEIDEGPQKLLAMSANIANTDIARLHPSLPLLPTLLLPTSVLANIDVMTHAVSEEHMKPLNCCFPVNKNDSGISKRVTGAITERVQLLKQRKVDGKPQLLPDNPLTEEGKSYPTTLLLSPRAKD